MNTTKLQIVGTFNADTLDGKHASEFALSSDLDAIEELFHFYKGDVIHDTVVTISTKWAKLPGNSRIESGSKYAVIFDGVEYICIGHSANSYACIGNDAMAYDTYTDTGEPFWIKGILQGDADGSICAAIGDHTIKVVKITSDTKQLDINHLPTETEIAETSTDSTIPTSKAVFDYVKENAGGGAPDWNASDGKSGHIQNRTHYYELIAERIEYPTVSWTQSDLYEDTPNCVSYGIFEFESEPSLYSIKIFSRDYIDLKFGEVYENSNNGPGLYFRSTISNVDSNRYRITVYSSSGSGFYGDTPALTNLCNMKKLDAKYLPTTKVISADNTDGEIPTAKAVYDAVCNNSANWLANDGEIGYIQNRTHYYRLIAGNLEGTYDWYETTSHQYTGLGWGTQFGTFTFDEMPSVYSIYLMGTNYANQEFGKVYEHYSGLKYVFRILQIGSNSFMINAYCNMEGFYGDTPELYDVCKVVKLPSMFIPDEFVKRSDVSDIVKDNIPTTNWNEIEDRPFYDSYDYSGTVIVENTEIVVDQDGGSSAGIIPNNNISEGKKYLVIFDDIEYICSTILVNGTKCLGNRSLVPGGGGTSIVYDEPFAVRSMTTTLYVYAKTAGNHTIRISETSNLVKQLDTKYIPTTAEISETNTDAEIPTAKAVFDYVNENAGGTPNWNAREGETGYIENRTHYSEVFAENLSGTYNWVTNDTGDYPEMSMYTEYGSFVLEQKPEVYSLYIMGKYYGDCGFGDVYTSLAGFKFMFTVKQTAYNAFTIYAYSSSSGFYGDTPVLSSVGRTVKLASAYIPNEFAKISDVESIIEENTPTPNWNAKEGEPGCIENRTHYLDVAAEHLETTYNWVEYSDSNYPTIKARSEIGSISSAGIDFPDTYSLDLFGVSYHDLKIGELVKTKNGPPFTFMVGLGYDGVSIIFYAYSSIVAGFQGATPYLYNVGKMHTLPKSYLPMDAIMAEIEARYTNVAEEGM